MPALQEPSIENNVLLSTIGSLLVRTGTVTYTFIPAGEVVDKGAYIGGSDLTRAWTEDEKAAFRAAAAQYTTVANVTFAEVANVADADIHAQMVDSVPGGYGGYAGFGTTFVVGSASEELLIHELGHSLGLGHPFDTSFSTQKLPGIDTSDAADFGFNAQYYSVMSYRVGEFPEFPTVDTLWPSTLMALDIAALQVMYGANNAYHSGDDSYTAPNSVTTIWDTGGSDSIDFSSVTTNAVIDLRAATLLQEAGGLGRPSLTDTSAEGRNVGGYTIAYGVTIENADGGMGDDILTGNAAANILAGGLGSDTLQGGAGGDRLIGGPDSIPTLGVATLNDAVVTNRALEVSAYTGMPGSVTLDMVVLLDTVPAQYSEIMSYKPLDGAGFRLDLQYFSEGDYLALVVKTATGSQAHWAGVTAAELFDGTPHRLTVTRDAASGEFRVYLDGAFKVSQVIDPGLGFASGGSLVFGQSQGAWVSANAPEAALWGGLGAIAIYDGALSDAEVQARSLPDLADAADPRLVSYWVPNAQSDSYDTMAGNQALAGRNVADIITVNLTEDDDRLLGGQGNDTVSGGGGTDTVVFAVEGSSASIAAVAGGLQITSAEGVDFIADDVEFFEFTDGTLSYAQVAALVPAAVITGTNATENINGTSAAEIINALDGWDWITPGGGNDTIDGGPGTDMVSFVNLPDTPGRTNVQYRLDIDLTAGTAHSHDNSEIMQILNVERVTGTIFADKIKGTAGDNQLRALGDYDWFTATTGNDTMDGGNGKDMISYVEWQNTAANLAENVFSDSGAPPASGGVTGVVVDLNNTANNTHLAAGHTYISIERITGSGRQDVFWGDGNSNDFRGLGDYDWFVGSTGGRERYFGGDGLDTVTYFQSGSGVSASLRNGAVVDGAVSGRGTAGDAALDLYFSIENLVGTTHADELTGNNERNMLSGLAGDDMIFGFGGIDQLKGGAGNDTIDGGGSSDYAIFSGNSVDYTLTRTSATEVTVDGADGTDSLINVEYFRFDDADLQIWDLVIV